MSTQAAMMASALSRESSESVLCATSRSPYNPWEAEAEAEAGTGWGRGWGWGWGRSLPPEQ